MPDGKPITDPEKIAAYVRSARIVYGLDDDQPDLGGIDNPPIVVPTLDGAKVRAWLPAATLSRDAEIELDERRAVRQRRAGSWRGYGCRSRSKTFRGPVPQAKGPPVSHKCYNESAADVFPIIGLSLRKLFRDERWKYSSRLWPRSCSRLSMPLQCGLTRLRLEGRVKSTAAESPPVKPRAIHFG
jgi:hypothetical protein